MRIVVVEQPGLDGMRPDIPQTKMPLNATFRAADAIAQRRKFQERNGWQFLPRPLNQGISATADRFSSVSRARYVLADRQILCMSGKNHNGFVAWDEGVAITLSYPVGSGDYMYRAMYGDQTLWCRGSGQEPMLLYSGTSHPTIHDYEAVGGTLPLGKAVLALAATPAATTYPSASYVGIKHNKGTNWRNPKSWHRVLERVGNNVALEGVHNVIAGTAENSENRAIGLTYPNVAVYGSGTITISGTTAAVTGGQFQLGEWGSVDPQHDALLVKQASGKWAMVAIDAVPSNTTLTVQAPAVTDASYFIMRRSPFTDACVHKGSPCFSGVAQWPSRLYIGVPGTNLGLPPGWPANAPFPLTNDPQFDSTDQGAFELFPIDVPDKQSEPIIAILNVGDAVLVCKRRAFHAVYGAYPDFTQRVIDDGAGCLHRGGAVQTFSGVWIAGDEALYTWRDGRMVDLSFDKTSTVWHSFTREFDPEYDYISIGERDQHLCISLTSSGRTRRGTWFYDLRRDEWMCEVSNFSPYHMFSGEQGGATVECLAVSDDYPGDVIDAGYMVEETKPRLPDGNGLGPAFYYETTFGLGQAGGIEGETILADVALHARVDSINPGGDSLAVEVQSHGGKRKEVGKPIRSRTLKPLISTDVPIPDRYDRRVNAKGRLHKIVVQRASRQRPPDSYCELMQINLSVLDAGMDT